MLLPPQSNSDSNNCNSEKKPKFVGCKIEDMRNRLRFLCQSGHDKRGEFLI